MHGPRLRERIDVSLGIALLAVVAIFALAYGCAVVNALVQ